MTDSGISGKAVAFATAGGLLLWSGIANRAPVDLLREILRQPSSGAAVGPAFADVASGVRGVGGAAGAAFAAGAAAGVQALGMPGALVAEARKHIGAPYGWGKAGPDTFDCSGLVVYSLRQIGVTGVPRFTTFNFGSWAKAQGAVRVSPAQFQAGDIILRTGHMAIAAGAGRMIVAPHINGNVEDAAIYQLGSWWGWRLWGGSSAGMGPAPSRLIGHGRK